MSASGPGNMRGPRLRTPLLLLLLLLTALTRTVFCQYEDDAVTEAPEAAEDVVGDADGDGADDTPADTDGEVQASDAPPLEAEPTDPAEAEEDPTATEVPEETGDTSSQDPTSTDPTSMPLDEGLSPIIILIPVVLVVVIIAMIVCGIFINRRWNQKARNQAEVKKDDPYLDGSPTEKVPMPMFEEDVPSVLELEMDEFDQWMKKEGEAAEDSNIS